LGNDVLDVKGGALKDLVHEAVLAALLCTRPDGARQFFRDGHLQPFA
jgi:hypothetical protein